jgi:hypothetical protein
VATEDEKGYVYRATLPKDALAALMKARFGDREGEAPAEPACAIVRRVDCADMKSCAEVLSSLERWTEGQIFNENAELRWRQTAEGYAVLLLTEQDNPPADFQPLNGSPFTVVSPSSDERHGFLLWGTRPDKDKFWETRIPRSLRYPIKTNGKPPQLVYRLYQEGAAVRWVRLVELVEVK